MSVTQDAPASRTWLVIRGPAPVVLGYAPLAWYALERLVGMPSEERGH